MIVQSWNLLLISLLIAESEFDLEVQERQIIYCLELSKRLFSSS